MKSLSADGTWGPKWPLMLLPPLLLFLKDVIAINAVLATEPGITERTIRYYAYSQLPGALFFNEMNEVVLFNYVLAFLFGGLIWFLAARRTRQQATQRIAGPEQGSAFRD